MKTAFGTALLVLVLLTGHAPAGEKRPFPAARYRRPVRIHIAHGLWWKMLRIHEASAWLGGAEFSASFDGLGSTNYHGYGRPMATFPRTRAALANCDLIVLAGSRIAAVPAAAQKALVDWVRAGGGLLVTGGPLSLDCDTWSSPLSEILPVTVGRGGALHRLVDDNILVPTAAGRRLFTGISGWKDAPRVYWINRDVKPREGSSVLLEAGGTPILTLGTAGRGCVAVSAATLCGEAGTGETPFWLWRDWPVMLGRLLVELVPATPITSLAVEPTPAAKAAMRKRLEQLAETEDSGLDDLLDDEDGADAGDQPLGRRITGLAAGCATAEHARRVLRAITSSGARLNLKDAQRIFAAIASHLEAKDMEANWRHLLRIGSAGNAALAIRMAGRAKIAEAGATMIHCAGKGLNAIKKENGDGGALPGGMFHTPDGSDERLRLAAVQALMDLGNAAHAADLRRIMRDWNRGSAPASDLVAIRRRLEEGMHAALVVLGDSEATVWAIDRLIANALELERAIDVTQKPVRKSTSRKERRMRKRVAGTIGPIRACNRLLRDALHRAPPRTIKAVCETPERWRGIFAEEALLVFLGVREAVGLDAEARAALRNMAESSPLPSIKTMCELRLSEGK